MNDDSRISAFLHYGYVPLSSAERSHLPWMRPVAPNHTADQDILVQQGITALRSAFDDVTGSVHIVPLSGGLDSRAILALLLERGLREQIVAVTFGVPRTFDFELGRTVAQAAGVRHEPIDLSAFTLEQDALETTARELTNWTYLIDAVYNRIVCRRFGRNATYWSGFMGDPLAGSHLLPVDSPTWQEARVAFAERNRYGAAAELTPPGFRPESILPARPILHDTRLCFDEQLDFALRQETCIRPLVLPGGYDYRTPFLHPSWVNFILNVPRRLRVGEKLYKQLLTTMFPRLFSLPVKANVGLPLSAPAWQVELRKVRLGIHKTANRLLPRFPWPIYSTINYLDFDRALRTNDQVRALFYDNLFELDRLNAVPWLDIDALWQAHQRGHANLGFTFRLLLSLAVYLRV